MRAIVAVSLVALSMLGAASASALDRAGAGAEECDGTFYATGGREVFDIEQRYLPAPLRSFPADCASRVVGDRFDGGPADYTLFYVDVPFDQVITMFQSLESAGWADGDTLGNVDPGDAAGYADTDLTAADLEALATTPLFVDGRFAPVGSSDTILLTYTDGAEYDNDSALDVPSVTVRVLLSGPFSGTEFDDPSVLSGLKPISALTPVQTGVVAGGAVILMLVVGWPSSLLNSVVGSRYDGLVRGVQARFRRKPKTAAAEPDAEADPPPSRGSRLPGWLMWPGFALAAILGAFVDPDFGINAMSGRVVVTLFLSFVLFNLVTWSIVRVVARRLQPESKPLLRFRWGTLVLVALAVLVARLLQLEPGIIFGLVAGVAYATALRASRSAIIVLAGSGFGLALGLVAWVTYSLLSPIASGSPDSVPLIFLTEFLAGVTVKGVSSLPLALLPFGSLDGAKLIKWRRVVWALAYAVGLAAFMLVLLTIPKAWGEVPGDYARWIILFGTYALVALVLWIVNTVLVRRRPPKETPIGEQPDAITID